MSIPRFFAPALDAGSETVALPPGEAEHLVRVLRLGAGDTIAVFNGRGREYLARVLTAGRRGVSARLLSRVEPAAEPGVSLTLVQAALKGDSMENVIRDAVMLGVWAVQPVVTERTETTVGALGRGRRLDRWRRVALASVKQSRRAVLPEVRAPLSLEAFLAAPPPDLTLMLVEPAAGAPALAISSFREERAPSQAAVLSGPEGGWVEKEWTAAQARGVRLLTLGSRTLRADAAPIAAISVLQFLWGDL